jgi:hypothetical protein
MNDRIAEGKRDMNTASTPSGHRSPARVVPAVLCWAAFIALILLAGLLGGWVAIGLLILHGAQTIGLLVLSLLIGCAAGTAWLLVRFATSKRSVAIAGASLLLMVGVRGVVWARACPDSALYLAREMAWDGATVWDYRKYPQRAISDGGGTFRFPERPSPQLFDTIDYASDGKLVHAAFDQFLEANHTTSFIVIQDGEVLYEKYFNGYQRDSIVPSFSIWPHPRTKHAHLIGRVHGREDLGASRHGVSGLVGS